VEKNAKLQTRYILLFAKKKEDNIEQALLNCLISVSIEA